MISDFVFLHEGDKVGGAVTGQRGFGEVRVGGEEVFRTRAGVCEVAAASAGDENFTAGFGVVLEDQSAATALRGGDAAHKAGGSGSDDDEIEVVQW